MKSKSFGSWLPPVSNRHLLESIRCDEDQPDVKRIVASSILLQADGRAHHSAAIAADLGWPLRRVETAAVAAEDRGWLTRTPKRRI